MRLLDTSTIKLSEFYGDNIPEYAILSHTWGKAEVSFHDLQNVEAGQLDGLEGYVKIRACCELAAHYGYQYVWIDTCCIDKTSSADLSEAINSMFRWYQNARICYAYLADFCMRDELLTGSSIDEQTFRKSRWFTRGWTLQELLAPGNVEFYDKNWHYYGSKSSLKDQISLITGVQQGHMFDISGASAAQKMSWASGRKTTRLEDIAYSLMGIFDVSMPLLYGEGRKAFIRLQHEIVKISDDESIFAWMDGELLESGVFAQTPHAFAESGDVVQIIDGHRLYVRRAPYAVTNRGLAIEIFASEKDEAAIISDQGFSFLPLNCGRQPESGAGSVQWLVDIELKRISRDDFVRSSPGKLNPAVWPINVNCTRLVYVRPVYILYEPHEQRRSLFINASSLWKRGLTISSAYGCQPKLNLGDGAHDESVWRIKLGTGQSSVALLFKSTRGDSRQLFGVILRALNGVPCIDLIIPSADPTFQKSMDEYGPMSKYKYKYMDGSIIHAPRGTENRVSKILQDNCWVSAILTWKTVAPDEKHYFVDFAFREAQAQISEVAIGNEASPNTSIPHEVNLYTERRKAADDRLHG